MKKFYTFIIRQRFVEHPPKRFIKTFVANPFIKQTLDNISVEF